MALTVVRGTLGRGDTDDTLDDERRTLAEAGAEMIAVPVAERERVLELLPQADGLLGFSTIDADMMFLTRARRMPRMSTPGDV